MPSWLRSVYCEENLAARSVSSSTSSRRAARRPVRQRLLRRPWAWTFELLCERDLEGACVLPVSPASTVDNYRDTPFLPFNPQIAA